MGYVSSEMAEEPDRGDATVTRLETSFSEERKRGAIRLPNVLTLTPVEKLFADARAELTERGIFPLVGPLRTRMRHTPIGQDGPRR
jgi:hypothetical protein